MPTAPPPVPARSYASTPNNNTLEDTPVYLDSLNTSVPDEPPPAYEAVASSSEQVIEWGPVRPFQDDHSRRYSSPGSNQYPQPSGAPPGHSNTSEPLSEPSALPPPSFPFWNGSSLSPEQTGFQPGPPGHLANHEPYFSAGRRVQHAPRYEPTTVPTAGQPLLHKSQLLVYPKDYMCPKCNNTGYKNNDPRHPCKGCWSKYGKLFAGPTRLVVAGDGPIPENFQRPWTPGPNARPERPRPVSALFPAYQAARGRAHPNIITGAPMPGSNALVVAPGDPRLGGYPCPNCGGSGSTLSLFLDTRQCDMCRGVGRVF